jgi:hypothetical protein
MTLEFISISEPLSLLRSTDDSKGGGNLALELIAIS